VVFAAVLEVGVGDEQGGEFPLGTGRRLQADSRQPADLLQVLLHPVQQLQHPLGGAVVLQRVQVGEAGVAGDPLVPLRVVLHRATAERIKVRVDGHVPRGQVHVVADQVDLAQLRQRRRTAGEVLLGDEVGGGLRRHVTRRQAVTPATRLGDVEDQVGGLSVVHVGQLGGGVGRFGGSFDGRRPEIGTHDQFHVEHHARVVRLEHVSVSAGWRDEDEVALADGNAPPVDGAKGERLERHSGDDLSQFFGGHRILL
jgi:hypothetical protein